MTVVSTKHTQAYAIFFLAAGFYLYEFVLQVAPSVMAAPMMQAFHVNAEGFGLIAACYFYAYAPMQLPAGLLFDRYGPRKLMTFAVLLCSVGCFFFALTECVLTAALGRFLIGIGSAFSFIGVLVLLSRWFPPKHFAVLAGIAQAMSSLGAMFGEMPLAFLINQIGWRNASYCLALLGAILAGLLWTFIRDYPDQATQTKPNIQLIDEWRRLMAVCRNRHTWHIGLYACAIWTPIAVFAVLWGVPYLQEKYHISVVAASAFCSFIWLGIGVGSPLLGWLSDKTASRRLALGISALFGLCSCIVLLYTTLSLEWMSLVLFCLGLGAGGQTVSFAVVKDNNPAHLVGTASGFNNLAVLIGGALFQPLVGVFLQHCSSAVQINNLWTYSVHCYQYALLVLPLSYCLALMMVLLLKESHPEARP